MTGLRPDQLTGLILTVSTLVGDWRPKKGRCKVLDLHRAVVLTLFLLRDDNVQDVAGELFGCAQSTVSRVARGAGPRLRSRHRRCCGPGWVRCCLTASSRRPGARRLGSAPTGERADRTDLFSGKHRLSGMNVQAIADLDGRLVDTGTPIGGSRHDSVAFAASGLAERWAVQLADGGPGMLADKGYPGCGPSTPYREPPAGH
ncbi:hypothetical protein DMB66_58560 [Actinoplanes sp. ATCC 53533]|uniref:transposase family protein n=1 Tax=Actinoplanes sp. ATCC 53533 TaxID=1288362 RepID=UPI000F7A2B46|nr:hypothetical protein DMB66_58560 [Actinoplanes sp. ATCC 53533]